MENKLKKELKQAGYLSAEGSMDYELRITKEQIKFNDWMYSKFKPYLKGDILETGSGCGNFSERLARDFDGKIFLTEIDLEFIKLLRKQFTPKNIYVSKLDLNSKNDFSKIKQKFDSILSSNVLEHIKDDVLALEMMKNLLKPQGNIVIYVPCHNFLFCDLDKEEGHYRRYSKKEIEEKAGKAGLKIEKAFWFNMFGIPARFLAGNLLKAKKTPANSFKAYNSLTPVFKFIEEKIFHHAFGVGRILILKAKIDKKEEDK